MVESKPILTPSTQVYEDDDDDDDETFVTMTKSKNFCPTNNKVSV